MEQKTLNIYALISFYSSTNRKTSLEQIMAIMNLTDDEVMESINELLLENKITSYVDADDVVNYVPLIN